MKDAHFTPDRPLMQDPAFAEALKSCGQEPIVLPGGQLLLQRRILGLPVLMLPRASPPHDLARQLSDLGLHRHPVILSPDHPCPVPPAFCLARPRDLILLDLPRDNAEARARLHPKWRNQLKSAEKRAIHIVESALPGNPHHPLLQLEASQARQRGYLNWPPALTAAFARAAPQQTLLITAGIGSRAVAHMLFLRHGDRATYLIGHTTAEGRAACAHNLLLWRGTRRLAAEGVRRVELGLVQAKSPGLNRFKLRTGARRQPTGGSWLYWRPFPRGARRVSPA